MSPEAAYKKYMPRHRRTFRGLTIALVAIIALVVWLGAHGTPAPKLFQGVLSSFTPSEPVTLLFAGDIMLGRQVGNLIERNTPVYPFEKIMPTLRALSPDLFVVNLEGPITTRNAPDPRISAEQPYSMRFQLDPSVVGGLVGAGITHVTLANNHSLDQGGQGMNDTRAYLSNTPITPFGFWNGDALGSIATTTIHGHDIVLIGLDTTMTLHDMRAMGDALTALPDEAFVVTFLHWGNEYETTHSREQEEFAHFLIDHGVDLIVGAHPHVVQDVETYNDKTIFYSLGNFVFDQYWNDDVQTGLMVLATLDRDKVTYEQIPIKSLHSQPYSDSSVTLE